MYLGIKYATSNDRKALYYKQKITPIFRKYLSENGVDRLVNFMIGPGLGMDMQTASVGHVYKVLELALSTPAEYRHTHGHDDKTYRHESYNGWHEMIKPTNEAWFDPWTKYLQKKGVIIKSGHELKRINVKNNRVVSCVVNDGISDFVIRGDEYVFCVNPFNMEKILKSSHQASQIKHLWKQHHLLNRVSLDQQISFRLGMKKNIRFPIKNIAFVMTDSEYNITFYPQEKYWENVKLDSENELQSLWSGTCIIMYRPGSLYNKPAISLTKDKLVEEIIYQLLRSKDFQRFIYDNNKFFLKRNDIVYSEIWYEWEYENGLLHQKYKKWVNNISNQELRFPQKTSIGNLYLGGAHTKTTLNIWSMEGAIESGKIISNLILDKYKLEKAFVYEHTGSKFLMPIKMFDDMLYRVGLPQAIDVLTYIVVIIIIVYFSKR